MQVLANNSYQPVHPREPQYSNKEIYEASQGNVIRDHSGELTLTPQGELNLQNKKESGLQKAADAQDAKKAQQRELATAYIGRQSKKSQVEIYLSVALESNTNDTGSSGADVIRELRNVQKQNNIVRAYAAYQEAAKNPKPTPFAS